MGSRSSSFEASLLYKTASLPALETVREDIQAIIETNGEVLLRTDQVDEMFTILTCEAVQVLLAFTPAPLPVAHFLNASRPGAASLSETEILSRLQQVHGMVTVLVIDRETPAAETAETDLKHDLCWDITECLFQKSTADIVFWSDTDMLYAAEEFERSCSYFACQPTDVADVPAVPTGIPAHFTQEPQVDMAVLASLEPRNGAQGDIAENAPTDQDTCDGPDKGFLRLLPGGLLPMANTVRRSLTLRRARNTAALALSMATIALTGLPNLSTLL